MQVKNSMSVMLNISSTIAWRAVTYSEPTFVQHLFYPFPPGSTSSTSWPEGIVSFLACFFPRLKYQHACRTTPPLKDFVNGTGIIGSFHQSLLYCSSLCGQSCSTTGFSCHLLSGYPPRTHFSSNAFSALADEVWDTVTNFVFHWKNSALFSI